MKKTDSVWCSSDIINWEHLDCSLSTVACWTSAGIKLHVKDYQIFDSLWSRDFDICAYYCCSFHLKMFQNISKQDKNGELCRTF